MSILSASLIRMRYSLASDINPLTLDINKPKRHITRHVKRAISDRYIFGNLKGVLKDLSNELNEIANEASHMNYGLALEKWFVALYSNVMNYYGHTEMTPGERVTKERATEIYKEYNNIIVQAFTPRTVSHVRSYENLERYGDRVMMLATEDYASETYGNLFRNMAIMTEIEHKFKNTKTYSDLSKIFGTGKFILRKALNDDDDPLETTRILEDVFESLIGAIAYIQRDIRRNLKHPESMKIWQSVGFADNLIRMIFEQTEASMAVDKPAKTYINDLSFIFNVDKEKITIYDAKENCDKVVASVATPSSVIDHIARQVGTIKKQQLEEALNQRYSSEIGVDLKHFNSMVMTTVISNLEKAGLTKKVVYQIKNYKIIPPTDRPRFNQITALAESKNYLIEVTRPKDAIEDTKVNFSLRHSDPYKFNYSFNLDGRVDGKIIKYDICFDELENYINMCPSAENKPTEDPLLLIKPEDIDISGAPRRVEPESDSRVITVNRSKWAASTSESITGFTSVKSKVPLKNSGMGDNYKTVEKTSKKSGSAELVKYFRENYSERFIPWSEINENTLTLKRHFSFGEEDGYYYFIDIYRKRKEYFIAYDGKGTPPRTSLRTIDAHKNNDVQYGASALRSIASRAFQS
jgi:hypothetical protein